MIDLSRYANKVYKIIGSAMTVHSEMGRGLLEPVYQEALHLELLDRGIANERELEIPVYYKKMFHCRPQYGASFRCGL